MKIYNNNLLNILTSYVYMICNIKSNFICKREKKKKIYVNKENK